MARVCGRPLFSAWRDRRLTRDASPAWDRMQLTRMPLAVRHLLLRARHPAAEWWGVDGCHPSVWRRIVGNLQGWPRASDDGSCSLRSGRGSSKA